MGPLSDLHQEFAGDFPAGNILMEENPFVGMGPLTGKGKGPILPALEFHAVPHQVSNHILGGTNHNVHRLPVIFIMARFHGVLKVAAVVRFILQHTDAALGQIGIAAFRIRFCHNCDLPVSRKVKGTVKAGTSASNY